MRTSQRLAIGREREVVRAEALTALLVRNERRHQLGLAAAGLGNVGVMLARASRLVVDQLGRQQVMICLLYTSRCV